MAGAELPEAVVNDITLLRFAKHISDAQETQEKRAAVVHAARHYLRYRITDQRVLCHWHQTGTPPHREFVLCIHFYPRTTLPLAQRLRFGGGFRRLAKAWSTKAIDDALPLLRNLRSLCCHIACQTAARNEVLEFLTAPINSHVQIHGPVLPDSGIPSLFVAATCSGRNGHRDPKDSCTHGQGCTIASSPIHLTPVIRGTTH